MKLDDAVLKAVVGGLAFDDMLAVTCRKDGCMISLLVFSITKFNDNPILLKRQSLLKEKPLLWSGFFVCGIEHALPQCWQQDGAQMSKAMRPSLTAFRSYNKIYLICVAVYGKT